VASKACEIEDLTLIALGRIPRCDGCPRYVALVRAHEHGRPTGVALPAVPLACSHQACAPLARRLERAGLRGDLPLAG